jgi:hypothetical protein
LGWCWTWRCRVWWADPTASHAALLLAFAIALTTGCIHALEVHNLERYQEPTRREPAPVRTRIAVRPHAGPIDALFRFDALLWQLG